MKKAILITVIVVLLVGGALGALYWYSNEASSKFNALIKSSSTSSLELVETTKQTPESREPITQQQATTTGSVSRFDQVKINGPEIVKQNKDSYIVAFLGDQGTGSKPTSVLRLIKGEGAAALVVLGDYDYDDNPYYWYGLLTLELGKTFPMIFVIGNHDELAWDGYAKLIAEHLKKTPNVTCQGTPAIKSVCQFRDLRIFSGAPGIESIKASSDSYADYFKSTANGFGSKLADTWNVCTWHKNQRAMQLGQKADEVGWGVYETCRELGFPVVTAHEHSYSRSFLMNSFKDQTLSQKIITDLSATSGFSGAKQADVLGLEKGKSFVTVTGLGGREVRPQILSGDWWSSMYTSNQGGKPGALFCVFNYQGNKKDALCYFKNADGQVIDVFEMKR